MTRKELNECCDIEECYNLKQEKEGNLKSVVKNVYMQTYNQRLPDEASKKTYYDLLR